MKISRQFVAGEWRQQQHSLADEIRERAAKKSDEKPEPKLRRAYKPKKKK